MRIGISTVTHRGLERRRNEDSIGWNGWSLHGHCPSVLTVELDVDTPTTIVVCDGLGGHAGGMEASRLACEILTEPQPFAPQQTVDAMTAQLTRRLQRASDLINDISSSRKHLSGMGCTVAGATVLPDGRAIVFSCGDSHCYRIEGREIAQLTARPRRAGDTALCQALGAGCRVVLRPDFVICQLLDAPGLLLCSDGLHNYAERVDIARLAAHGAPDLTTRLRDLALSGGGGDNISVVHLSTVQPMAGADAAP